MKIELLREAVDYLVKNCQDTKVRVNCGDPYRLLFTDYLLKESKILSDDLNSSGVNFKYIKGVYLNSIGIYTEKRLMSDIDLVVQMRDFFKVDKIMRVRGFHWDRSLKSLLRLQKTYMGNGCEVDIHYSTDFIKGIRYQYLKNKKTEYDMIFNMIFLIENCLRDLSFSDYRVYDVKCLLERLDDSSVKGLVQELSFEREFETYLQATLNNLEKSNRFLHVASFSTGLKRKILKILGWIKIYLVPRTL